MRLTLQRIAALLLVQLFALSSFADTIHVDMSGVITDPGSITSVSAGDTWSLTVYLNSNASDSDPSPWLGVYRTFYGELSLGTTSYTLIGRPSQIRIDLSGGNDFLAYDFYNIASTPDTIEGYSLGSLFATFQSSPGIFADDTLPNIWGVGIDDFTGAWPNRTRFTLNLTHDSQVHTRIRGEATAYSTSVTPVPAPATAWLFVSALGWLGWAQRKTA